MILLMKLLEYQNLLERTKESGQSIRGVEMTEEMVDECREILADLEERRLLPIDDPRSVRFSDDCDYPAWMAGRPIIIDYIGIIG